MDVEAYKDLFGTRRFTSYGKLSTGKVVQFTYDNEQKYALVLDPDWEGKLHALSLKSLSPDSLKTLLNDLKDMTSREEVYANYKSSQYTESRPYRTYTISKISALREIYLKQKQQEKKKKVEIKETPKPKEPKTFEMYGD